MYRARVLSAIHYQRYVTDSAPITTDVARSGPSDAERARERAGRSTSIKFRSYSVMFCPIASDLCAFRFFVINGWPPAAGPHYRQSPDPRTNDLRDSPVAPHVARLPREPRPALEPGAAPRLTACTVPLAHQHHSRDRSNSCSAIERGGRLLQCPTCARRPSAQRRARARARWL